MVIGIMTWFIIKIYIKKSVQFRFAKPNMSSKIVLWLVGS